MQERRKLRETSASPIPPGLVRLMRASTVTEVHSDALKYEVASARFHVYSTSRIYLLHGRSGAPGAARTSRLSTLSGRTISRDRVNFMLLPEIAIFRLKISMYSVAASRAFNKLEKLISYFAYHLHRFPLKNF